IQSAVAADALPAHSKLVLKIRSRFRQFPFHQLARLRRQPMEANADAVSRIAIDDIAFHDDMLTGERDAQRERIAHRNVGLRAHVKSADADVLNAGLPCRIDAVKAHIEEYPRALKLT